MNTTNLTLRKSGLLPLHSFTKLLTVFFCLATLLLPATAADLQLLINEAIRRGEKKIVLPPGEHRLAKGLQLKGLSGVTLDGTGATLIFTNLLDGGILAQDCTELVLRGFTIDFDPLPFTQGTVEKVDPVTCEVTFTVHDGYRDLEPLFLKGRAHVFSPKTLSWKTDAPDLYATEAKALTPRQGVLRFAKEKREEFSSISPGDYLALDFRNSRGIRIQRSQGVRLENLTFWSAPSIAVVCRYMDGENFFRYKIERGPLPPGATIPRLLSTSADGLNYAYARTGAIIDNCDFSFMADDGVNLHGIAFYVAKVEGNTLYLLRPYPAEGFDSVIKPGDEVLGLDSNSFDVKGRGKVTQFTVKPHTPDEYMKQAAQIWKSSSVVTGKVTVYQLDLAAPLGIKAGDFLEIPAIAGPNYIIRNSRFHDHRGRGLRLMSSSGLVENNIIENTKQSGISIGPEFTFAREAGWVHDVIIRNNTVSRCSFDPCMQRAGVYAPGAISIFHRGETPSAPLPEMRQQKIVIEKNRIEESGGPAIHINQSRDVKVTGNTIRKANLKSRPGAGSTYKLTTDKPINVDNSTDVVIDPDQIVP
ncbi:MAG: alpha-mannosidase [Verrucomicrobia bacterium Tous-C9LFEB]|nr:MAG: alpha-mannosidase [Verrucomicrobia bacterium Tous-C9LFEB]